MLLHDLGANADTFTGRDAAICPDLEDQFVVVCNLSDAGVLHGEVHSADRGVDAVHGDHSDGSVLIFVLLRQDIPAAFCQIDLHDQRRVLIERCDVQIRIEDLNIDVALDISRSHFLRANLIDRDPLGVCCAAEFDRQLLQVEDDFRHIFLDAGDGREFMKNPVDLDRGNCSTGQGAQKDSSHAVAQRCAVASFQRLNNEFPVIGIFIGKYAFDRRLFNFDHQFSSLFKYQQTIS